MLLLTMADLAIADTESQLSQQQTAMPRYDMILSWNVQRATWWQADNIGPLPPLKWKCFFLTGVDTYSGYGFAFLAHNASAKTTIHGLTKCLILWHGISHSMAADQGTHFTAWEVRQWALEKWDSGSTDLIMFPHLEETDVKERRNGVLKTQL